MSFIKKKPIMPAWITFSLITLILLLVVLRWLNTLDLELMLETKLARLNALIENKNFNPTLAFKKRMGDNIKIEEALYHFQQAEMVSLKNRETMLEKQLKLSEPLVKKGIISPLEFLRLQQSLNEIQQIIFHRQSNLLKEANQVKKELCQLQANNLNLRSEERLFIDLPL